MEKTSFKKIGIVGSGSWGTALAVLLANSSADIRLWAHNSAIAEEITTHRTNTSYLPGICIPPSVAATNSLVEIADAEVILIVTPSHAIRHIATQLATCISTPHVLLVSCTKGIEHNTGFLMSQVLESCLPDARIAVLSGPNHAIEIARKIPAATVLGSRHPEILGPLQTLFSAPTFRVYTSLDSMGIQLGGALKNVFAIAAGIADGLEMGDNAKAALVTRALAEMIRLGVALGGQQETFCGLSGIGDLMTTCFSQHSRNRRVGERLALGEKSFEVQSSMHMVAEGIPTALSAWQCAKRAKIDAPLIEQVHTILFENKAPLRALEELLDRSPKQERD